MALTRSFRETIREELASEDFRRAFLCEAVGSMVAGDLETAKSVLREYVNGTVGFLKLGAALGRSPKSLMRMLSPTGNPQARGYVLDDQSALRNHMAIFVDGRMIRDRARLADAVKENSTIYIFQALSGG